MTYDVAIIGAGIVGSCIARELSKYKLAVCMVEKADDVLRNRGITVYVYGKDSSQSCAAAQKLSDIGYNSVSEIGSYSDWTSYLSEPETESLLADDLG